MDRIASTAVNHIESERDTEFRRCFGNDPAIVSHFELLFDASVARRQCYPRVGFANRHTHAVIESHQPEDTFFYILSGKSLVHGDAALVGIAGMAMDTALP